METRVRESLEKWKSCGRHNKRVHYTGRWTLETEVNYFWVKRGKFTVFLVRVYCPPPLKNHDHKSRCVSVCTCEWRTA